MKAGERLGTGYKIVYRGEDGRLRSISWAWDSNPGYRRFTARRYSPAIFAHRNPDAGPLGLFCTEEDARAFMLKDASDGSERWELWTAAYVPAKDAKFWPKGKRWGYMIGPAGTVYADSVKLLELVP